METSQASANPAEASDGEQKPSTAPLQAELQAARAAYKAALLQLGLLSRFQRDVRTLGVEQYASKPPTNLTNGLVQAMKAYNDACDSMESIIMRARAAILHEAEQANQPIQQTAADLADSSKAATNGSESTTDPAASGQVTSQSAAPLLEDEEMEDLFGPGTAKTDTTGSNSTPATAANQQAPLLPLEKLSASQFGMPSTSSIESQTSNEAAAVQAPGSFPGDSALQAPQSSDVMPSGDLTGFGQLDMPFGNDFMGTEPNFSQMTTDDFNFLLSSLGATNGLFQSDALDSNAMSGLDFNTDLNQFLSTDMNTNP